MKNQEYICAVCGKMHTDIVSRANCEIECMKKKAEEEKQAALRKKEAEYHKRKEEVDNAFNTAYELKKKFIEDYGNYTYGWRSNNLALPSVWSFFSE